MLLSLKRVVEILSTITITTTTPSNSTPTSLLNAKANTNANLDSIPTSETPLQILSCTNTSAEYTSALGARALGFARKGSSIESESETAARTPATSSGMLQWHAAVIKAGWVQRWVVTVRR
ncbi:hypothetical protein BT96DRAFT_928276 [Gymnopus androsaceus JB14]|uniref:Uncharacterized protein n=1 Tax=Gymnopus androsaceus JB14 TaxID=1447944 RepID=A0A6A4GLA5_9AGAR|nr:hypothetical protein BT96DRAFT_928276 [Gymnopus androsaceus JB14]